MVGGVPAPRVSGSPHSPLAAHPCPRSLQGRQQHVSDPPQTVCVCVCVPPAPTPCHPPPHPHHPPHPARSPPARRWSSRTAGCGHSPGPGGAWGWVGGSHTTPLAGWGGWFWGGGTHLKIRSCDAAPSRSCHPWVPLVRVPSGTGREDGGGGCEQCGDPPIPIPMSPPPRPPIAVTHVWPVPRGPNGVHHGVHVLTGVGGVWGGGQNSEGGGENTMEGVSLVPPNSSPTPKPHPIDTHLRGWAGWGCRGGHHPREGPGGGRGGR